MRTNTRAPIKHRVNDQAAHKLQIYTPNFSQIWCRRLNRAYSELDTWDTLSRMLSLTKWILHSADTWYLNFPLGGGNVSEWKSSVMLARFRAGSEWKPCFTVAVCHRGDKDEVMEGGTPEGATSKKSDCCYSQGHLHRGSWVNLKANYHLAETQPTQPDHGNLFPWFSSVLLKRQNW